ncbi:transposase [Streptomyces sp. NPDC051218]|uniref:transposase n=1 Tax=Streptomyces sp. NPDC051218 TaxID=3365645 RepID=UPI0037B9FC7B
MSGPDRLVPSASTPARRRDGDLRRRAGAGDLPDLPARPAWSPDGRRIKAELDYSRGPEKTCVYGALRVRDGQQITMTASSRNSVFYQRFLQQVEDANPDGEIWLVTDNLSSHNSLSTQTWLEDHPRIHHAFIPVGACWLILQEGWWRIFRKAALAGRSLANPAHIGQATALARNRPTQPPRMSMGLGPSRTTNSLSTTPLRVPPLRNPAY